MNSPARPEPVPGVAPAGAPVAGSLEYWAQRNAAGVGLIEGDRTLTYAQWNAAANRIAGSLAARGLGSGDVLAVRMRVRTEWPLLASAAAKLGCSLVGINWRLTPAEVRHMLVDSHAVALACDDPDPALLLEAVQDLPMKVLVSVGRGHDRFTPFDALLAGPGQPLFSRGRPPLIVYTSGTTGFPKGVRTGMRSRHFSETQMAEYLADVRQSRLSPGAGGCVLVTMPMHHASGPSQIWGALHAGRTIVLMRRFEAEPALELIQKHRVTDWNVVPTMLQRISTLSEPLLARQDVTSIRRLTVGAAPVSSALKAWAMARFGEDVLAEGYGTTETSMLTQLAPGMQRGKAGSCGCPYRHVTVEIRDGNGSVLAAGKTGEIWARTPATMSSYVGQAPLEEDELDQRGFFRTGDVGHLDEQGYLYITDRSKDLIVSGGVNIYPAEIERVLLQHPAVLDAAVIGMPDAEFGEQIWAFCEVRGGMPVNEVELTEFAAGRLASYKRPRLIRIVPCLPRNTMGKVLKRELRDQYRDERETLL